MNQLGSRYAVRRLTLTAGNLSILDIFDANPFNHDPRTQFLNWTLMTHGAYDFAADARGYTWGAAAEYQGDGWALRAGRFAQPKEPNQLPLDSSIFSHYGDQIEFERSYELDAHRPGVVRVLAFRNRAVMARYDDALALSDATGSVPSLDAVRRSEQVKVGMGVNLEQTIAGSLGGFVRAMWADGKTETYAFTEADRSASFGLSAGGAPWGRADAGGKRRCRRGAEAGDIRDSLLPPDEPMAAVQRQMWSWHSCWGPSSAAVVPLTIERLGTCGRLASQHDAGSRIGRSALVSTVAARRRRHRPPLRLWLQSRAQYAAGPGCQYPGLCHWLSADDVGR